MNEDKKNLYLAMILSGLVLFGWTYYADKTHQAQVVKQEEVQQQAKAIAIANGQVPQASSEPQLSRDDALALSPRVTVNTRNLKGTIALKGGRIDDMSLKTYHETIQPDSPLVSLLSPAGAPNAYYVEMGFVAAGAAAKQMPDKNTLWTADSDTLTPEKPVTLTYDNGQGLVFKRLISVDDQYMFTVKDSVENKGSADVALNHYALVTRHSMPVSPYASVFEGLIGVLGESKLQQATYAQLDKNAEGPEAKATQDAADGNGGWIGFTDRFWTTAVIPDNQTHVKGRFQTWASDITRMADPTVRAEEKNKLRNYQADTINDAQVLAPNTSVDVTTKAFVGAKEIDALDHYETADKIRNFDLMIDWGWFGIVVKPLMYLLIRIYGIVGNFGLAIMALTVIIKAVLFPLANRSYQSMARMKALQPQMQAIKERYPDDKVKQQQETMELYKREKVNPLAGCLPMLVTIPVFLALVKVIYITIELRHAPFFGWVKDLSVPDPLNIFNLFGLLPFDPVHIPYFEQLPVIGHALSLGPWPVLMGFTMFLQMKMNPEPTDPVQKQMFTYMPIVFTFFMSNLPAGLTIYYVWNNLLSIIQQSYIIRQAGGKVELFDNLRGMIGLNKPKQADT
ncbi:membrane protein insertase YidC [Methylovirgula sp. 4M-Z18]|uniref:membrane protein insertase YidC n=1 Tax=Methylovirgula sp. 4M-Z18 TaxID=2293567 RepID=UPI000E2FC4F7|nr:membrane protein insertase YidC [Methylovirgula sp. 4M-Z18]RFB78665.1 membrane protein insertase YidC [Methylovirgula sp. 4M-Z18]